MSKVLEVIERLNNTIKVAYNDFSGVYLYGSYATNKNTENSDIDIVAIFEKSLDREQRLNLWNLIGKIELDFDVILDLHPMAESELKKNPIYYNQVVNNGIFYGAR